MINTYVHNVHYVYLYIMYKYVHKYIKQPGTYLLLLTLYIQGTNQVPMKYVPSAYRVLPITYRDCAVPCA